MSAGLLVSLSGSVVEAAEHLIYTIRRLLLEPKSLSFGQERLYALASSFAFLFAYAPAHFE